MRGTIEKLRTMLEPSVENLGYELLHIEQGSQGKQNVLRFYIDAPGGIRVDDCEAVSRQIGAILDIEDPLDMKYLLEVSSPGLARPLVKPEHFRKCLGENVRIVMRTHVLGRRRFTGRMVETNDINVVLEVDGESYELAYDDMETARLEPVF